MNFEQLKLKNQLCFPLYAASRLVTREYQPHLDEMEITYPQYLVLLVLWENDNLTVNEISSILILNTNTITPLLKRMETQGLVTRLRSKDDERVVVVSLTEKGEQLKKKAAKIPENIIDRLFDNTFSKKELLEFKDTLQKLIVRLNVSNKN